MAPSKAVPGFCATVLIAVLLALSIGGCTTKPTYPQKAIEFVVPFAAGGGTDVIARIAAKYLAADLGVPVNVVNKTGGNAIPGVLAVVNAAPDGYTLLIDAQGTSSIQSLLPDLPYKIEDRTYGPTIAGGPNTLVVNGKSPWKSLKDVAEAAKKDPGSFTWTRLGGTSVMDFTFMQFFTAAGIDIPKTKPVEFSGAGPGIIAVAGGHVMFGGTSPGAVMPLAQAGDLKILVVTGDKRVALIPDVPSATEAGFPAVNLVTRYGISAPKDLPKEVLDRLDAAAKKITQDSAYASELEKAGIYAMYAGPKETGDYFLGEVENFKKLSASFGTK